MNVGVTLCDDISVCLAIDCVAHQRAAQHVEECHGASKVRKLKSDASEYRLKQMVYDFLCLRCLLRARL